MQCRRCSCLVVELDRDGITLDRCERCRGIWLDRGELEKLLAGVPDRHRAHRDDGDDGDEGDRRYGGSQRRRSWWEIFD